jgi:hypothetical protein
VDEDEEVDEEADQQDEGAEVEIWWRSLELGVRGVAAGHAAGAEEELGEEGGVEADEDEDAGDMAQRSLYILPNILGHQWWMPARKAMIVPPIMT